MSVAHVLLVLGAILAAAKIAGEIAEHFGQAAVIGELLAGVLLGVSVLRVVDPSTPAIDLLSHIGVVVLLFLIGLETDIKRLLRTGAASAAVAITGVAVPFALGYGIAVAFGAQNLTALVIGAAMTATSVG